MKHLLRHGAPIFPLVVSMKPLSLFLIALALLYTPPARAQRVVVVHDQNIMSMPPFKECHASTLVELADGKLMAASKNGTNWQDIHVLTNESTGEFSYPAVIQTADGLVHLSYTQDRKNIRHMVLHIN